MASLFEKLDRGKSPPATETRIRHRAAAQPPVLLNWLRTRWPGTTIAARDIYRHSPIHDRKIALDLAEELVAQGALSPIKTHRYDRKAWQIVGKKGE